jgi:hypothetical protein
MDGDGQMDGSGLPGLIAPVLAGEADYAKGNRFWDTRSLRSMPMLRLLGNGVLSLLTKAVSGYWSIFDPTNGYTAVRSDVLALVNQAWIRPRYFFETSMLIALNAAGAVTKDVYMDARYRDEKSSLSIALTILQFPPLLVQGLMRRFVWRYVIRDFNALTVSVVGGVVGLTFGVVFGSYHWWKSIATGVPATAGQTILAALPILLGFQLLIVTVVLDVYLEPRDPVGPRSLKRNDQIRPLREGPTAPEGDRPAQGVFPPPPFGS